MLHAALLLLLATQPAAAEPLGRSGPSLAARAISERNHLGLLEYCRAAGLIGEEAVALQRHLVETLPASPGEDLEAAGRQGLIAFDGTRVPFPLSAAAQGITVKVGCEQTALRVLRQEGGQESARQENGKSGSAR